MVKNIKHTKLAKIEESWNELRYIIRLIKIYVFNNKWAGMLQNKIRYVIF